MPIIDANTLPEPEREYAHIIWHQSANMDHIIEKFSAALKLFDMCERKEAEAFRDIDAAGSMNERAERIRKYMSNRRSEPHSAWKLLAAREGAVCIWNYLRSVQVIKASLDRTQVLRQSIRMGEFEAAFAELRTAFPDIKEIRDSILHPAEFAQRPGDRQKFATKPLRNAIFDINSEGNLVSEVLSGRTFMTTEFGYRADGKMVSYEFTDSSLQVLVRTRTRIGDLLPAVR